MPGRWSRTATSTGGWGCSSLRPSPVRGRLGRGGRKRRPLRARHVGGVGPNRRSGRVATRGAANSIGIGLHRRRRERGGRAEPIGLCAGLHRRRGRCITRHGLTGAGIGLRRRRGRRICRHVQIGAGTRLYRWRGRRAAIGGGVALHRRCGGVAQRGTLSGRLGPTARLPRKARVRRRDVDLRRVGGEEPDGAQVDPADHDILASAVDAAAEQQRFGLADRPERDHIGAPFMRDRPRNEGRDLVHRRLDDERHGTRARVVIDCFACPPRDGEVIEKRRVEAAHRLPDGRHRAFHLVGQADAARSFAVGKRHDTDKPRGADVLLLKATAGEEVPVIVGRRILAEGAATLRHANRLGCCGDWRRIGRGQDRPRVA